MTRILLLAALLSLPGCASMARAQGRIWADVAPDVAADRCMRRYAELDEERLACLEGVEGR